MWVGAAVLQAAWRASGEPRVPLTRPQWKMQVLVALLTTSLTYALISWGEEHVAATTTVIVIAIVPLVGTLIARVVPPRAPMTGGLVIGLLVGLAGVVVVAGDPGRSEALGLAAIGVASVVFGGVMVLAKHFGEQVPDQSSLGLAARHMTVAALGLTPLALGQAIARAQHPDVKSVLYVAGLGVVGYGFVYLMYYWLLRRTSVAHASMSCYIQPVSGMLLAWLLLGEGIGWRQIVGTAVILSGVLTVDASRSPEPVSAPVAAIGDP
jgi:drug/metabolite transporter (DMT)-like permease